MASPSINVPGGADRTIVIGLTGSGKTVRGAQLLSIQRFSERPWVILDFKGEELWDKIGSPPLENLKLGKMPGKKGLYRVRVNPWQMPELGDYLFKIWHHGNIGIFCDEATMIKAEAVEPFEAILRQGRSKLIPVIACTQRPVDCNRELFTESQYMALFQLKDIRDYKTIAGMTGDLDLRKPLPPFYCYWYDVKKSQLSILRPSPDPVSIASEIGKKAPFRTILGFKTCE